MCWGSCPRRWSRTRQILSTSEWWRIRFWSTRERGSLAKDKANLPRLCTACPACARDSWALEPAAGAELLPRAARMIKGTMVAILF